MAVVLVCNPLSDVRFTGLAERLAADTALTSAELQARLREQYPRAVVRRRLLEAEQEETWYVYREGAWVPGDAC